MTALLSLAEVARWLGVSRSTIWRLARSGDLRGVRVGGQARFERADVEALIDRGRMSANNNCDPSVSPGRRKKAEETGRVAEYRDR